MSDIFVTCRICGNEVSGSFNIFWCDNCNCWLNNSNVGIDLTEYFNDKG